MLGLGLSVASRQVLWRGGVTSPPFTMQNLAGTTVTDLGSSEWEITKTAGSGWSNATASSVQTFAGDFILRFQCTTLDMDSMGGIDTDPIASNRYDSYLCACNFSGGGTGTVNLYEGVTATSSVGVYSAGSYWYFKRSGTTVSIGNGGTDSVTGYVERASRTFAQTVQAAVSLNPTARTMRVKRIA